MNSEKHANKNLKILKLPRRKGDMTQIISNTNNLHKFINWVPKFRNIKKIVKSCLIWEKKNKSN